MVQENQVNLPEVMCIVVWRKYNVINGGRWVTGNDKWSTKYDLDGAYWLSLNLPLMTDENNRSEGDWVKWRK